MCSARAHGKQPANQANAADTRPGMVEACLRRARRGIRAASGHVQRRADGSARRRRDAGRAWTIAAAAGAATAIQNQTAGLTRAATAVAPRRTAEIWRTCVGVRARAADA